MPLLLAVISALSLMGQSPSKKGAKTFKPAEVLVQWKTSPENLKTLSESKGLMTNSLAHSKSISVVKSSKGEKVESLIQRMKKDPNVAWVQPNYIYRISQVPNDPYFANGQTWAAQNYGQRISTGEYLWEEKTSYDPTHDGGVRDVDMDLPEAWDQTTDCRSARIAILDTGMNYNHMELRDNLWTGTYPYLQHGYDFADGDSDPMDTNGHGTHVAGIMAAEGNNFQGGVGVCWRAELMAVRVLDTLGEGSTASLIQGIQFAIREGAKIINLSLGGAIYDALLANALKQAESAGVLVITAAGNDGLNNDFAPTYPCNLGLSNMICVSAIDQAGAVAWFSNYGKRTVDLAAPGVNILSTWPGRSRVISDSITESWASNSFGSNSSGWALGNVLGGASLVNPPSYGGFFSRYRANLDDRTWKSFNLGFVDVATLEMTARISTQVDQDFFSACVKKLGGDCFRSGGKLLFQKSETNSSDIHMVFDLSKDAGPSTSIGFRLTSNGFIEGKGVAIRELNIRTLSYASRYNLLEGTSMATPFVTGVAAMVWSAHPELSLSQVKESILVGGKLISQLTAKTKTGRMLSAKGALDYAATIIP